MSQDQPKASLDDLFDEPIKDSDDKHLRLIKGMLIWFKPSNQEALPESYYYDGKKNDQGVEVPSAKIIEIHIDK